MSGPASNTPTERLSDFIDMEAYDVVSGEHHRAEVQRLSELLVAAEDHIAGLCKELDSRAPGWENEAPWYARRPR